MKSTDVRTKILEMLPMSQQDAWKKLRLEHRQVSKVVLMLEKEGFLKREKDKHSFHLTITPEGKAELKKILKHVPVKKAIAPKKMKPVPEPIKKKENKFAPLVSNGMFSPCAGCPVDECNPASCEPLTKWAA